jgi:hypothetical protein
MDILVRSRGKNFQVIPQTDQAREYLRNETGAVPWQWTVRLQEGEMFLMSKKEKDSYEFLDYLMNSGYTISKEE